AALVRVVRRGARHGCPRGRVRGRGGYAFVHVVCDGEKLGGRIARREDGEINDVRRGHPGTREGSYRRRVQIVRRLDTRLHGGQPEDLQEVVAGFDEIG